MDKPRVVLSLEDSRRHIEGIEEISLRLLSWKGAEIPAVMFLPQSANRAPAVVVIPGHVTPGESGLDQLAGREDSYQHGAARALARAGFVTLAIELRGFGRLGPPRFPEHELVAYNAILGGTSYKALIVKDIKAAVDFLVSRSEVDAGRLGITGASLGGELAVTYAALDSRIRAVAFSSYGGSTGNFREVASPPAMKPHYCHVIPGSNFLFEQQDIFMLLAPRPTLGVRGFEEPFSHSVFRSSLERVWAVLGEGKNLKLATAPGGHEFFVVPTVEFFLEHLRPAP
jgi:dienelactone hydrolase